MVSQALLLADQTKDYAWFPQSASSFSAEVDATYMIVFWICMFFMVPITFVLFYFAIRYAKRKGEPAESDVTHNTKLEVAWSVLPCFLLVYLFYIGSVGYIDQRKAPEGSNVVNVVSQKWSWLMDYGNGVQHPELHLVVGRPTQLIMRSRDVIHSLFVPAFRAKKDIVPGRYNEMWFDPSVVSERVSDEDLAKALKTVKDENVPFDPERFQFTSDGYRYFDLYCTEYCGKDHSKMQTVVVVHSTQEELYAWIKKNSGRGETELPAEYGGKLFARRGCGSCHSINGTKIVGPTFQGLFGTEHPITTGETIKVDENYVRESILEPKAKIVAGYQPVMPSFKGQLTDDDIDSLIAYIKTLNPSTAAPTAAVEPPKP